MTNPAPDKEVLKPCPFCGEPVKLVENELHLWECKCGVWAKFMMTRLRWQNAYCWKEISRLEAELLHQTTFAQEKEKVIEFYLKRVNRLNKAIELAKGFIANVERKENREFAIMEELEEALAEAKK